MSFLSSALLPQRSTGHTQDHTVSAIKSYYCMRGWQHDYEGAWEQLKDAFLLFFIGIIKRKPWLKVESSSNAR